MATKLIRIMLVAVALLFSACSAPWSSTSTVAVVPQSTPAVRTSDTTTAVTSAVPTATRRPTPTVMIPTPTPPPPTPTVVATPTSIPTPVVHEGSVAQCCGVFAWVDSKRLMVFDAPSGGQQGTYLINVQDGSRMPISSGFGTPSISGLIAFPNAVTGVTEIRREDGSLVSAIQNGGRVTWISPDGKHLAWLVDQGIPNSSSLVNRVARLTTANIDGTNQKSLVAFEASSLQWLPDNLHVIGTCTCSEWDPFRHLEDRHVRRNK